MFYQETAGALQALSAKLVSPMFLPALLPCPNNALINNSVASK